MPKPPRRPATATTDRNHDPFRAVTVPKPPDPASLAAWLLLRRALRSARKRLGAAAADGMVTLIILEDPAWAPLVHEQWKVRGRPGRRESIGRPLYSDREDWRAWRPDREFTPAERRQEAEVFAEAVSAGFHCVGFAADEAMLPADMLRTVDIRLRLPSLRARDVAAVARALCGGEPTIRLAEGRAASLTPRLLRLARRAGQDADAYLGKLSTLLDGEPARDGPARTRSPREEPTLDRLFGMDEAVA